MKMFALVMVLLIVCGCNADQPIETPAAENDAIKNDAIIDLSPEITQPPCLICEYIEIKPSADGDELS